MHTEGSLTGSMLVITKKTVEHECKKTWLEQYYSVCFRWPLQSTSNRSQSTANAAKGERFAQNKADLSALCGWVGADVYLCLDFAYDLRGPGQASICISCKAHDLSEEQNVIQTRWQTFLEVCLKTKKMAKFAKIPIITSHDWPPWCGARMLSRRLECIILYFLAHIAHILHVRDTSESYSTQAHFCHIL